LHKIADDCTLVAVVIDSSMDCECLGTNACVGCLSVKIPSPYMKYRC